MKFKKWIPGIMLGAMMAAMVTVPVMADNINSGSTPPPIEFSRVSSTSVDDNSENDSGKVYDFKDSKTSGAVVVTKTWDDSLSNDERSVPDISISTAKPSKNPLGYTITYHGNGLTFADGTTENEIIVNSSGKILSGQYKELVMPSIWYSDVNYTNKIELNSKGLPLNGVTSDLDLYAKSKTFVLKTGSDFKGLIPSTATSVIFTDEAMPTSAALIDADADGDGGVVAWMDGTVMKVSTQTPGKQIIAATDCQAMFKSKSNLILIDFSNLDTGNVTDMHSMFYGCSDLTNLDLTHLGTSNVTDMHSMFYGCSGLTDLDLTHLNTGNVTDMSYMFDGCTALTTLSPGEKFAFVGSDYQLPSGTWYASDGTAYTSDGNSCTIPNNKADTYTRR